MKRRIGLLFAVILTFLLSIPVFAATENDVVALGADLTAEDRETVLGYLGLTEEDLSGLTVLTITTQDAHRYLDGYLPQEVIGWNALSCCRLIPREEGYGIHVTAYNINYVTEAMYENALATAGVRNAEVIVASPNGATGTTALVGMLSAYSAREGVLITPEQIDSAVDEMVTTGALADSIGDKDKASDLIAAAKQIIASENLTDEEGIGSVIEDLAGQFDITLTEENKQDLMRLLKKISGIKLDPQALTGQAGNVYERIRERGIDLSAYGVSQAELGGILGFLARLWNSLTAYFSSLF